MKLKLVVAVLTLLTASCVTIPLDDRPPKQCSDTPHNAVARWFHGIAERNPGILQELILDGASIFAVFDDKGGDGQEIVRQIVADPISGVSGGCACTLLSIVDTDDPHEKIVTVKRLVDDEKDDKQHTFKRAFHVRFERFGNCLSKVKLIDDKWIEFKPM